MERVRRRRRKGSRQQRGMGGAACRSFQSGKMKAIPIRKKARYSVFNGCPSKNTTYALQDDDQFSIGGDTKSFRIDAIISCVEFAHTFRSSQKNVYEISKGKERIVRRV